MIDPILLMPPDEQSTQDDSSNYIQVEEAIDCRNSNRRFFSLLNRESRLNLIISEQSTIVSCKLDRHELVVDQSLYNETHETWAIGDRPYQKLSNFRWNSHVRGSELVLSSSSSLSNSNFNNLVASISGSNSNPHTTLYFELSRLNELNCMGKLKSIHMQHQVFYFNLNQATGSQTPVDGHLLALKCNGSLQQIQMQPTKLLCHCNKLSPSTGQLAQSLISDIPRELARQQLQQQPQHDDGSNPDDTILCDAIYSLESTSPLDFIQAHLQYLDRRLVFEVRSVKSTSLAPSSAASSMTPSSSNSGGNNSVSSSTTRSGRSTSQSCTPSDLRQQILTTNRPQSGEQSSTVAATVTADVLCSSQQTDDSIATSSTGSAGSTVELESRETLATGAPSSSSEASEQKTVKSGQSTKVAPSGSSQHPSTILRIRVRVTNFGVCILPHMMTNYTCSYKLAW